MPVCLKGLGKVAATLLLLGVFDAGAAVRTWSGGGASTNLSVAGNWGVTSPVTGDSWVFGSTNTSGLISLNNDLTASLTVAGITFNSGSPAYVINGNALTLGGNIVNNSASMITLGTDLVLSANRTVTNSAAAGSIVLNGGVSGSYALTAGGGIVTLAGINTYSGGTTLSSGSLAFPSNNNLGSGTVTLTGGKLNYTGTSGFGGGFGNTNAAWTNILSVTGTGTLSTANGAAWQLGSNVLTGSGALSLTGGLFVIYGTNSYTGALTVRDNVLELGTTNAVASSSITVNSGAELAIDATTTNPVTLNGGILSPNNAAQTASGAVTLGTNGGTIALRNWWSTGTTQTLYLNGVLSGSGSLSVTSGGTLSIGNNNSYTGGTTITGGSSVTSTKGGAFGTGTVTLSGATINGGATFGNAFVVAAGTTNTLFSSTATGSTITLSGPISGSGTFYVSQGSGTHAFLLSGDNSGMTGTMQVGMASGGNSSHFYLNSYTAGSANALWIPSGVGLNATNTQATPYQFGALTGSGGLYNITGGTVFISVGGLNSSSTFTGAITDNGLTTVTKVGTGTQVLGGANTYAGQTILSSGVLSLGIAETAGTSGPLGKNTNVGAIVFNGGTLQHSAANTYDYSSRFSQDPGQLYSIDNNGQNVTWATALTSSNGSLVKFGAGTLTLSSSNTFGGATTINAGAILLSLSNALQNSAVILNASNALRFNNGVSSFILDGLGGAGALGLTNNTSSSGIQLILSPESGESFTYAGALSGGGTLTIAGSGTQILSGVNVHTGGTVVSSGTLALGNGGTLASTNAPLILSGGSLNLGGQWVTNGSLTMTSGSLGNGTLSAGSYSVTAGTISAVLAGSASLTQRGSGTSVLSGANLYTGTTILSSGVLNAGSAETPGTSGPLGRNTNIGAILFSGGVLQYSGANQFDYSARFSTATGQQYSVDNNGQNVTWSTPLASFGGSLSKTGSGTLTLAATNTYTGATTLGGGALVIAGTTTASTITTVSGTALRIAGAAGAVNVSGTVGGSGTAGALTLNAGSTVNPGSGISPATFRVSSLLINGGSTYAWNFFGSSNDLLSSVGSATFSNSAAAPLNIVIQTNASTVWNQSASTNFTILTAGSLQNFSAAAVNVIGVGSGLWSLSSTGTSLSLVYTVAGAVVEVTAPSGVAVYQLAAAGTSLTGSSSPLLKTGDGEYVLNMTNTYGGNTTIASGTLTAANNSSFGTSQTIYLGTATNGGSNAVININTPGVTVTNMVSVTGSGINTIANSSGGSVAYRGIMSLATNTTVSNLSPSGGTLVLGGSVIGNGILTVAAGSGTVVLSGNNSYGGGTVLSSGVLLLSNNAALGIGNLSLAGSYPVRASASITVPNAVSVSAGASAVLDPAGFGFTLSGPVSGAGDLTVSNSMNSGTLTLSGTNSYTGNTAVLSGTLALGSISALPATTALTVGGNGTLNLTGFSAVIASLNDGGSGALITNSGAASTLTVNGSTSSSYAGRITGGIGLTMAGVGTLSLGGSNGYTGPTTLSSGVVSLGNSNAIGSGTIIFGGGVLQYAAPLIRDYSGQFSTNAGQLYSVDLNGMNAAWAAALKSTNGTLTIADSVGTGTLTLSGSNAFSGGTAILGGAVAFSSNTNMGSGTVTLNGGTLSYAGANGSVLTNNHVLLLGSNGGTVNIVNGSNAVTQFWLNAANALQGYGSLTVTGPGSPWSNLRISQTNIFGGSLTVTGASVEYGVANALSTNAAITAGPLGELAVNVNVSNSLTLDGGTLSPNNSSALTYTGPVTLTTNGGTIALRSWWSGVPANFAVNGGISSSVNGDSGLTVTGAATLTLSGNNSYAGGTVIINGATVLLSGGDEVMPSTGVVAIATGSKLDLGSNSQTLGGLSGSGTVLNSTGYLALNVADGVSTSFGGTISGAGMLFTAGTGTQTLTGSNTYSGGTVLAGGAVLLTNGGTLGDTTQMIVVDGSTLDLGGGTLVSGDYRHYSGTLTNGTLNAASYTVGSGIISAALTGSSGLSQNGGGVTVLSGSNSYTGVTTVNSGTLRVNGSLIGTGTVTVSAGATLSGAGTVGFVTVNDGGTIAPGAGGIRSVLTVAGLTLSNAASVTLQVNAPGTAGIGYDQINLNGGSLTYGGNLLLQNDSIQANLTNTFSMQLFKGFGSQSGDLNSVTLNGYILGTGASLSNNAGLWSWTDSNTGVTYSFNETNGAFIGYNPALPEWVFGAGSVSQIGLTNGSTLIFDGCLSGTLTNNSLASLAGIVFTNTLSATNVLAGNDVTLGAGGIANMSASPQSIALNVTLGTNETFLAGSGSLNIAGNITNAGYTLTLDGSAGISVSGKISGTGGLVQTGSGTTVLTGSNAFSGITVINGGTLQVGDGGILGTLGVGGVSNNATLIFNRSDSPVVSNAISGSGSLAQRGAGTLILSGSNTYAGATMVNAGTLQIGSGGTTGTLGAGGVSNNATLVFNRSDSYLVSNVISGSGFLMQSGTGTLILTGNNAYRADTIISSGTLQVGNGGFSGTLGTAGVQDNGRLVLNRSDVVTVANAISGIGALTHAGTGTTIITGSNSYAGITTVNAGTLQVGNGGTSGSLGAGPVLNNATLSFSRSDFVSISNAISGTGAVAKSGLGKTALTANNTYSGITTVGAGILQIGNGGTSGSLGGGNVMDNATLAFNRSDTITVANVISGTGAMTQSGNGTLILTANNTYSGITTVSAGILQIGNGGASGSPGAGSVIDNAALAFNRADTVTLLNSISGSGALTQSGAGMLLLTGTNSYTGLTSVNAGSLSLASSGLLSGSTNLSIASGGTLLLGAANQINTNAVLNLAGGTLSLAASATRASFVTMGTLTLTANSTIDFGNLAGTSSLTFGSIVGLSSNTLTVFDWNGSSSGITSTTGGANQFTHLFDTSSLTAAQLAKILFYSGNSTSSGFLGTAGFSGSEIVPIVPVPEPGIWIAGLMLLAFLLRACLTSRRNCGLTLVRAERSSPSGD